MAEIKEHMKIIGKDGAYVGAVDRVEGNRIKLTKKDSPAGHEDHHHYIDRQLVGAVEGDIVGKCRRGSENGRNRSKSLSSLASALSLESAVTDSKEDAQSASRKSLHSMRNGRRRYGF
jgi:hypothetical protein